MNKPVAILLTSVVAIIWLLLITGCQKEELIDEDYTFINKTEEHIRIHVDSKPSLCFDIHPSSTTVISNDRWSKLYGCKYYAEIVCANTPIIFISTVKPTNVIQWINQ